MVCTRSDCPYIKGVISNRQDFFNALRNLHATTHNLLVALETAQKTGQPRYQANSRVGFNYTQQSIGAHAPFVPYGEPGASVLAAQQNGFYEPSAPASQMPQFGQFHYPNTSLLQPAEGYNQNINRSTKCSCCCHPSARKTAQKQKKNADDLEKEVYLPIMVNLSIAKSANGSRALVPESIVLLEDSLSIDKRKSLHTNKTNEEKIISKSSSKENEKEEVEETKSEESDNESDQGEDES